MFERHVSASDLVKPPVDLVVWPEDVIDTDGAFVDDPWFDVVGAVARRIDAPMVVGTVEGAGSEHFTNSSVLVDADGRYVERYDKVHRVPFGEYVPLRALLEPIAGDALPDRDALIGAGANVLDVPGPVGRVTSPISWEIFFADRTREGPPVTTLDLELLEAFAEHVALWISARRASDALRRHVPSAEWAAMTSAAV